MVTSGSAVDVVRHLKQNGEEIIWAPDMYLGDYVRRQTGADMLLWQGSCIVHEEFKGLELELLILEQEVLALLERELPDGRDVGQPCGEGKQV